MNNIYKILTFIFISIIAAYASHLLNSSFANKFAENILALLTTLFAINIASSTLIASKIREIQDKTSYAFKKSKTSLKSVFHEQIVIIVIAFVASLLRESSILQDFLSKKIVCILSDSVIFFTFIFFIDVIKDIGVALFELLDFEEKE
ncbi:hypothetical protein [Sphingobacterium suaedae]|uniref:Uncharacterized protein n=1 Tax=Sphingobacterium suaedae TaxID=1686402 RepID=A0ABW5KHG9_9SPHI